MRSRRHLIAASLFVLFVVAGGLTHWLSEWVDHARIPSPDNEHTAIVQARRFRQFQPSMPGQSGDKPGRLALFAVDGRFCGAIELPMVNLAYDLEWDGSQVSIPVLGHVPLCH